MQDLSTKCSESLSSLVRELTKEKNYLNKEFDELMNLYTDVAVSWLIKICNKPIVSLLVDPSISLDYKSFFGNSK